MCKTSPRTHAKSFERAPEINSTSPQTHSSPETKTRIPKIPRRDYCTKGDSMGTLLGDFPRFFQNFSGEFMGTILGAFPRFFQNFSGDYIRGGTVIEYNLYFSTTN